MYTIIRQLTIKNIDYYKYKHILKQNNERKVFTFSKMIIVNVVDLSTYL